MSEKLETDWQRRLHAGEEAIELLDRAGFYVHDFEVSAEAQEAQFELEVSLSVGEMTRPLNALEDESDTDLGADFALGLTAGLMADDCGPCDRPDCPRSE